MSWSWSELVRAHDGDEERALAALHRMPGVGRYQDDVHRSSIVRPVLVVTDGPGVCSKGHPRTIRNGLRPNGRQIWQCEPCYEARRWPGGRKTPRVRGGLR